MDDESYLHEATKEVIKKVVHTDPLVLAKVRLATVFNLRKLTDELREKEATLTQSLHPDVRKRAESKNIALFEHVLQKLGFCDMGRCLAQRRRPPCGVAGCSTGLQATAGPSDHDREGIVKNCTVVTQEPDVPLQAIFSVGRAGPTGYHK